MRKILINGLIYNNKHQYLALENEKNNTKVKRSFNETAKYLTTYLILMDKRKEEGAYLTADSKKSKFKRIRVFRYFTKW